MSSGAMKRTFLLGSLVVGFCWFFGQQVPFPSCS